MRAAAFWAGAVFPRFHLPAACLYSSGGSSGVAERVFPEAVTGNLQDGSKATEMAAVCLTVVPASSCLVDGGASNGCDFRLCPR